EAQQLGLTNHVYPLETYDEEVSKFIDRFNQLSSIVVNLTKTAFRTNLPQNFDEEIDKLEEFYLKELMATNDANEGLQAFMEKRAPVWKNN
ncbi:MAG: enoyl-CoA hydratase/isomerase family protein, partial [Candidatus Hodarchaeales archaeon]